MKAPLRKPPKDTGAAPGASGAERVRRHRQALRTQGLRPLQIWVPDTRKPGFAEEARRQSLAVSDPAHENEVFDLMDTVLAGTEWS